MRWLPTCIQPGPLLLLYPTLRDASMQQISQLDSLPRQRDLSSRLRGAPVYLSSRILLYCCSTRLEIELELCFKVYGSCYLHSAFHILQRNLSASQA